MVPNKFPRNHKLVGFHSTSCVRIMDVLKSALPLSMALYEVFEKKNGLEVRDNFGDTLHVILPRTSEILCINTTNTWHNQIKLIRSSSLKSN